MDDPTLIARWQFAFTVTYHYLFPGLTMGLALLLLILKTLYLRTHDAKYNQAVYFWGRIFAATFVMGVVTGIPMEFQFGTNWARFSRFAGGIIAQTLAMEGAFAFFLESAFVGLLLFGEKRFGQRVHWFSALMVFIGTWASGYFIIATNAWMQHPVGYRVLPDGRVDIANYWAILLNPWILPQYLHNQSASVLVAAFVMAGLGAFYLLCEEHLAQAKAFISLGVVVGAVAAIFQLFPSGDLHGQIVAREQPATLAAMEGLFRTERAAGVVIVGQPDMRNERLDNAIVVPGALSFLSYRHWTSEVAGLDSFPKDRWPDAIPLLYYSYHVMIGLGTIMIVTTLASTFLLWRRKLFQSRRMLWALMLMMPFPYIANAAGWMTAEFGRQPWLVYGLLRTTEGGSPSVSAGNVLFTLIGFAGMYLVLGLVYLFVVLQEVRHGPEDAEPAQLPAAESAA